MKRLISEEEIKTASAENANNMYGNKNGEHQYFNASIADFKSGVFFAEEKIKNIAIEFYNWMQINHSTTMSKIYEVDGSAKIYSTDDLFEKFLSTRK